MSTAQKETIAFISTIFMKVILAVCGALLTMMVLEMKSDIKSQGATINAIQVDMATMKGDIKNIMK